MNIKPLNERIVVKRIEEQEQTRGGLYIPQTAKEKPIEGIVLASDTLAVRQGDRVLFSKHVGVDVNVDGEALVILQKADILGLLT
jgi:chaperonin GroES